MILFGTGSLYGVPLTDATGAIIANPTPRQFGVLQGVKGDLSFDAKTLYGAYSYPVAFGRGKAKTDFSADSADFDLQAYAALFFGITPTAGILSVVDNFAASVPPAAGPYTIVVAPPNAGTYSNNLGVRYASTGIALTRVATSPAAGQYSVAAGTYTFAAADAGAAVLVSYEYTATSTTQYELAIANPLMGQAPSFQATLSIPYNGRQLVVKLNNCVSSKMSLPFKNEDFPTQSLDFTALADASGFLGTLAVR
jgi:hypothetical protein